MTDPITYLQVFFTFLSGSWGAAIIGIVIVIGFFRMAAEHRLHYVFYAILGGIGVFTTAWIMSSILGHAVA